MKSADLTGAIWFKSSRSNGDRNCVEVAILDDGRVATRDSKERGQGAALVFATHQWQAFQDNLLAGELNH
ncbi:DUF397 domain-containing protein [Streptomyces lichenis]|uniref:DUF397 domain-containing protein n=1 Tax=Streptomyces lichenis TaxID=2306967 RepID=A0ABT0I5N4_9ACTN|nr:DUF397 domain-containing protein [Streptomyces lichenis]MCK8676624.1 DUF397 domain-containing protein [Streptomyces lichenis]